MNDLIELGYVVERTESTPTVSLHLDPQTHFCTSGPQSSVCL